MKITASYDMVHWFMRYNGHELTIIQVNSMVKYSIVKCGLGSNGYSFVTGLPFFEWGHCYGFARQCGLPEVRLLV
jgi:hypothetical protein